MANEKRLIDANEVISSLRKMLDRNRHFKNLYSYRAFERVVKRLEEVPTVDAVEVVRCKDCKHYGWEQEPCHGRTQHFCKLHKGLIVVDRDTFCSYGERREGE